MKNQLVLVILTFILYSCSSDSTDIENQVITINPVPSQAYFPPTDSNEWETITISDLGWNEAAEQPLYDFLENRGTDAFLILKNGRMVVEKYFGDFTQDDNHVWNSAGKTLTAMTVGIAQEEGFLDINATSMEYLGSGWSSLTTEQEQNITVWNHLTMTTGLDYEVDDIFCTDPECLLFKNEPGEFWFYHNAPYTLLDRIITGATGTDFKDYFYTKIRDKIGMQGIWLPIGYNNNYYSTARSMARFGILNLNNGVWDGETILGDNTFLTAMKNTSQDMNEAYGYLYWLNGKSNYRVPGAEIELSGKLIPNAPNDLYAGMGKNDQKLYVVPSEELVIVRTGDDAGETLLGPSSFDNELWALLNDLMD
ncbi:serine hydrolase [Croceitalea sp. MTPC9]|uniref:serine hydrolase domain-containing protein n=1 Tax=unclassified Croceitalea TaxID=2632280 RepID=UPI002B3FD6FB|nr:serine hydrolase [Croceitalea sp. MTPC6]GMN17932.1 serine hydrolase [Croceitalea sp. MTPC9]